MGRVVSETSERIPCYIANALPLKSKRHRYSWKMCNGVEKYKRYAQHLEIVRLRWNPDWI
jgi:hypothetical protein